MRRSTLQRKDRGELMQIARALGGQPSTRARKDELMKLIIDLTSSPPAQDGKLPSKRTPSKGNGAPRSRHAPTAQRGAATSRTSGTGSSGPKSKGAGRTAASKAPAKGSANKSAAAAGTENTPAAGADKGNHRRRRRTRDRDRDRDEGWKGDSVDVTGQLDLRAEGYGFLRVDGYLPNRNDAYVPVKTIRQFGLRRGDHLCGTSRPANRAEKNPALLTLDSINGAPAELSDRPLFEQLSAVHASRQIKLEHRAADGAPREVTARLIDLVAPVGLGQRVLVYAPRGSGVSRLLAAVLTAIEANEPDISVMGLFIDQRPEDISAVRGSLRSGEVAATSFDQPAEEHVQTAEMTVERAKRLAESGRDVALAVDSLTSLARAYNTALSNAGKAYSGNVESGAVHMPKKLFGAGRNLSQAGSITMIASLVTDKTRYRSVDQVVREEFTGTANTEIHLDRWAAERGLVPSVDVLASFSRDEHRFVDTDTLRALHDLRRGFAEAAGDGPTAVVTALETALARLRAVESNADLLS